MNNFEIVCPFCHEKLDLMDPKYPIDELLKDDTNTEITCNCGGTILVGTDLTVELSVDIMSMEADGLINN